MATKYTTIVLVLFALGLVSGCSSTQVTPAPAAGPVSLERGQAILVATPADGRYGTRAYPGSGDAIARDIESAFEPHAASVVRLPYFESSDAALVAAHSRRCRYLVFPKVTHWEDRATEWSGRADKVAIRIRLFDVRNGQEISSVEIKGRSSWFTLGGDHPEQLLKEPIAEYVATLF